MQKIIVVFKNKPSTVVNVAKSVSYLLFNEQQGRPIENFELSGTQHRIIQYDDGLSDNDIVKAIKYCM